ncbi:MAG: DUF1684 domain-containing protein [Vicinamibacterales bacterium]
MASLRHRFRERLAGRLNAWRAVFVLAATSAVLAGCQPSVTSLPYPERIASQRATKDEFLRTDRTSPILPDTRSEFLPLAYFPIDESYVAAASLSPSEMEPTMEMPTSTGERRQMRRAGALKFALKGQPMQLTAFVEAGDTALNRLFLPFNDLTNGTETYPAGRYLDLTRNASGIYEIDFNLAYQPYCYFNPTYDCPYPPAENRLKTPVRAGEKMKVTMR